MKTKHKMLILLGLAALLLACSMPLKFFNAGGGGGGSSGTGPRQGAVSVQEKKFDGELKIVDQWYSTSEDGRIDYALLVENTSSTLTVTGFTQDAVVTDTSGNPLAITNYPGPIDIDKMVYPASRMIICQAYSIARGSKVGNVSFSLGSEILAADLGGSPNPIRGDSIQFFNEKIVSNKNTVGTINALLTNLTDQILIFPTYNAALFDSSGKLIGCGWQTAAYGFIPAKASLPIRMPLFGDGAPARVELYPSLALETGKSYSGVEPIQVSDVKFSRVNTFLVPSFTLKNTGDGMIVGYLVNYIAYGPNGELVYADTVRNGGFPAGWTFGPGFTAWQLHNKNEVARLEVQVLTLDMLNTGAEITPGSISLGPALLADNQWDLMTTIKNDTGKDLRVGVAGSCYDSAGKLIGFGTGFANLPARAETPVTISQYNMGAPGDPSCSSEARIELNLTEINEQ